MHAYKVRALEMGWELCARPLVPMERNPFARRARGPAGRRRNGGPGLYQLENLLFGGSMEHEEVVDMLRDQATDGTSS